MTRIKPYIPFICIFLVFYALLRPIGLLSGSDDTAHFEMLEKLGGLGWVLWRAEMWEPRLFSDLAYAIFIWRIEVWQVVNAIVAALLMFGLWRASFGPECLKIDEAKPRKNAPILASALICLLFFFIYPNAVTSSSIWFTGSFNYLWPVAALVFGLTPFIYFIRGNDPYPKKIWIPIGIFASLCAGFTLQTALVAFGVSLVIMAFCIVRKRKPAFWLIVHFAVIAACAVFFAVSTLTSARLTGGEELALFPQFASFDFKDKLLLGVHVYDLHLLRSSNLLFLTLALLAGYLAFLRLKKLHAVSGAIAFFPAFFILLNIIPFDKLLSGAWNYTADYADTLGSSTAFGTEPAAIFDFLYRVPPLGMGEPRDILMASLAFLAVIFMAYPIFFAFKKRVMGGLAALLYLASFLSGIIMGFSPTIFASGSRPFFLSNILILFLCAMLVREGMGNEDPSVADDFHGKTRRSKIIVAAIAIIAVYAIFLYAFVFASVYYWWY